MAWLLDAYESQTHAKLCDMKLRQQGLQMALSPEDSQIANAYTATLNRLLHEVFPWEDSGPQSLGEVAEQMRQQYLKSFPDPDSPEGKAEVQKLLNHWQQVRDAR